ncbi:transposase [Salinimicrobium sp. WS361]|uniref:transposase n=1 Tax=Salinimicrobium sp. WS361 TaxID=3425123 RepID=UPI003D6FA6FD
MKIEPIETGNFYHIYNRGNNGSNIFFEEENYSYFLRLYEKYIPPVADTFAWCLMRNHFHLLLYLKTDSEIKKEDYLFFPGKESKKPDASRQLGHLFNAYAQAINKKYGRTGSLMEKSFERKRITSEDYLKQIIFYIHNNPVHHGVVQRMREYPWSSYNIIISDNPTIVKRKEVIEIFGDIDNFKAYHERNEGRDLF